MDFLKKHYEKVVLAVILLALLGTGIWLAQKVGQLSTEIDAAPHRPSPHGEAVARWPLQPYSNALAALRSPPQWEKAAQPLFPAGPPPATNFIPKTVDLPFTVYGVRREPFKLLFKAYSFDAAKGEGYNFQINMQFRSLTFFVLAVGNAVSNRVENTGYQVTKFEHKTRQEQIPGSTMQRDVDESELTVQHPGEAPIVMGLGKETFAQEPVAEIQCDGETRRQTIRRGQSFVCAGKTYNVVDMSLTQMVIVEPATGKREEINLAAGPAPTAQPRGPAE